MVNSNHFHNNGVRTKNGVRPVQYRRLTSMGKASLKIINELYNPLDAASRFINLTLQNLEEHSEHRQFLLDSKSGIRKASLLLRRLNKYARKLEKEFSEIVDEDI